MTNSGSAKSMKISTSSSPNTYCSHDLFTTCYDEEPIQPSVTSPTNTELHITTYQNASSANIHMFPHATLKLKYVLYAHKQYYNAHTPTRNSKIKICALCT